jgi:iron complex outermembrane receptor protein
MKNRFCRQTSFVCLLTGLAATNFLSLPVFAQNSTPSQSPANPRPDGATSVQGSNTEIEEVVVTAQRRAEPLSNVPIAVTAVTPHQLETAGVATAFDLPALVPGLVTSPASGANAYFTPFLRGVGSSVTSPGDDPSVSVYVDGVYQADKQGSLFDLADVDHIEVLKGPQGTLFGRNATGGAILVVTKQPSFDPSAWVEASYGRFDETQDKLYVTGPITDTLAASISVNYREGGNYATNAFQNSRFGGVRDIAVDAKVLWKPSDDFQIDNTIIYNDQRERPLNGQALAVPGTIPLGVHFGGKTGYSAYTTYTSSDFLFTLKNVQDIVHATYSTDYFDIKSITAYYQNNQVTDLDYDVTSADLFYFGDGTGTRDVSQELQIVSKEDSPFKWIGGLYYMSDIQGFTPLNINLNTPAPYTPQQVAASHGTFLQADDASNVQALAAYAQATYPVTEDTNVTAGFRYTQERRHFNGTENLLLPEGNVFSPFTLAKWDVSKAFRKPSWRISIDHHIDDDLMVYFSYNRGFKSGAYNTNAFSSNPQPVQPESIDAIELGFKSKWLNRRLQIDASAFYYDYSNIQVEEIVGFQSGGGGGGGTSFLENAAAATIYGLDADAVYLATPALRIHGNVSLLSAQYTEYPAASGFKIVAPATGLPPSVGLSVPIDASNTTAINAPTYSFSIGADYNFDLADGSSLLLDGSYTAQGHYKTVVGDGNYYNAYGLLNATLTWTSADERYYARLYGKNLGDEQIVGRLISPYAWSSIPIAPITYGVAVGVHFK